MRVRLDMQAFKVELAGTKGRCLFCSIECTRAYGFDARDGEYLLEREYSTEAKCDCCAILINDAKRAQAVVSGYKS